MTRLTRLYLSLCGKEPLSSVRLTTSAGSNREYYRLTGEERTVIGVIGTSEEENAAFIYLSRHFRTKQLPVPEVYAVSEDGLCYIQQDLGSLTLYDALAQGRKGMHYNDEEVSLLVKTIRRLPEIQMRGAESIDYSRCFPVAEMDQQSIFFDLNYFKYCFLKPAGIEFNEVQLEKDFHSLADNLVQETLKGFMYRDCQARNVMLCDAKEPYFIDFQGGRKGPCYYDLASFLWQASAHYGKELRGRLTDEYYSALENYAAVPERAIFDAHLQLFVLFRTLQVLGAYGFRGLIERKPYFIKSIPYAIANLRELLQENDFAYPYLVKILNELVALPQYNRPNTPTEPQKLIVTIVSFAYKYGLPTDDSGNGGGYIFDCRGTNNPGRYPQFYGMTGMDEPVRRFIEEDGGLLTFLDNVYQLAERHVENYLQRGFTSLMFAFGCTGGQHRSVYAAEHLAAYIKEKYGVEVHIYHREQGINKVL